VIVTITPTVMDGTVLRWYAADDPAEVPGSRPVLSVSRNRVDVLDKAGVTPEAAQAAAEAYAELKTNRYADVRGYATHYRTRGGLTPVKEGA
jgi:hypothetical protein